MKMAAIWTVLGYIITVPMSVSFFIFLPAWIMWWVTKGKKDESLVKQTAVLQRREESEGVLDATMLKRMDIEANVCETECMMRDDHMMNYKKACITCIIVFTACLVLSIVCVMMAESAASNAINTYVQTTTTQAVPTVTQ